MNNPVQRVRAKMRDRLAVSLEQRWRRQGGIPTAVLVGDGDQFARMQRVRQLNRRVAQLEETVAELEEELIEARALNRRVADVIDVVTEVLVPAADRDDERLRAALVALEASLAPAAYDDDSASS